MADLFTPKQLTEIAGISLASVRNYVERYKQWYSPQATPPTGEKRFFTEADLLLTCYITQTTQAGSTHSEIAAYLEKSGGVPSDFAEAWELPSQHRVSAQPVKEGEAQPAGALVPSDQARLLWAMVEAQVAQAQALAEKERARADRLQEEALEKERALLAQLADKQRAIGELIGELRAVKEERKGWLDRILGR